ncbi:collagen alpha-1(I) chain-like [Haliaeetus albicilla]|uniref:collagen alpha-1(I) chain-like n=1 Tax=Haliaeetus albicilla TaxID=8969 RepID=UPI0037E7E2D3
MSSDRSRREGSGGTRGRHRSRSPEDLLRAGAVLPRRPRIEPEGCGEDARRAQGDAPLRAERRRRRLFKGPPRGRGGCFIPRTPSEAGPASLPSTRGRRPAAGAEPAPPRSPPRRAAGEWRPDTSGGAAGPGPGPGPATARAAEGPQGPRARLGSPRPGLGPGPGRGPPQRLPSALREGERRLSGRPAPSGGTVPPAAFSPCGGLGGGCYTSFPLPFFCCCFVLFSSWRPARWLVSLPLCGRGVEAAAWPPREPLEGSPGCLVSGEGAGAAGSECPCGPRHAERPCPRAPPAWPLRPGLPGEHGCHPWGKGVRQGASLDCSPLPPQRFQKRRVSVVEYACE